MYKDQEKQKEAVREAVRRFRAKGITVIPKNDVIPVIPKTKDELVIPKRKGVTVAHHPTCKCMRCMG